METWPSIFPGPTPAFGGGTESSVIKTEMDSGRTRRRRRNTTELRTFRAAWDMNDFQFGMFQSWFLNKISDGADKFQIALPLGGEGLKVVTACFDDGKYAFNHRTGAVLAWTVTANLEVENADVWTAEIFDTLLLTGDVSALEDAVNELEEFVT